MFKSLAKNSVLSSSLLVSRESGEAAVGTSMELGLEYRSVFSYSREPGETSKYVEGVSLPLPPDVPSNFFEL